MERLDALAARLDALFGPDVLAADPAFSRFVPLVYDAAGFDWRRRFEPGFVRRFNGLVLRGAPEVGAVHCAAFPSTDVLDAFLAAANPGDLLLCHHPIDLRSGDPRGEPGAGFVPIAAATIQALAERDLSFYACHAPMDTTRGEVGTVLAMADALGATPVADFFPYGNGFAGAVCTAAARSTDGWAELAREVFRIPYVDRAGPSRAAVDRIALVPGGGNSVGAFREAEQLGAQVYITGEIRSYNGGEYGAMNRAEVAEYLETASMSLLGVSHVASEQLVMGRQMVPWLRRNTTADAHLIAEPVAWR